MVTQELLDYIKGELANGYTREEIDSTLVSGGGWTREDLEEAFNKTMPAEKKSVILPNLPNNEKIKKSKKILWYDLAFILACLVFVISWYFYRPQIISFWRKEVETSQNLSVNSWNVYAGIFSKIHFPTLKLSTLSQTAPAENFTLTACGNTASPNLKNSKSYENNAVLNCLGASAISCKNASGVLTDAFFPTNFKTSGNPGSCNFKLSYPDDSTLVDITGNKLAGQYISCPLSIVKAVDDTNPNAVKFIAPNTKDSSKYASQIYFYGTLGLFVENNLDKNKIETMGCSGPYIDSVIASYNKMQSSK